MPLARPTPVLTPSGPSGRASSVPLAERNRRAAHPLLVGAAAAAATCYVALVDPNRPGHYLTCPVLALTGLACAGCGGLRATHDLVHGDLAGAWAMNPLWVLLAPLLVVAWAAWLLRAWRGEAVTRVAVAQVAGARASGSGWSRAWLPWAFLVVVVAFSIARNVPQLSGWLAP